MLSATIIAKNEEACIEKCLKSIQGVDEIIVVDTGSTDKTVEIASKYAKVFTDYKWNDDFAEARNYAISKATGDWILSIDCDEELKTPIDKVKEFIKNVEGNALGCKLVWDENHFHTAPRVYKVGPKWIGKCHEYITCDYKNVDIEIKYNKSPAHESDTNRNFRILSESVKDGNPRDMFYLSKEYWDRGDYKNCLKWAKKHIKLGTWRYERADSYLQCARCYFNIQEGDKAREYCLNAIMLNPNFSEALRFMADISWEKEAVVWRKFAEIATDEDVLFMRKPFLYSGSYPDNRQPILEIIKGLNPQSILDMGVGSGFYGEIIKRAMPDTKIDGIEIFPKYKNRMWDNYDHITEADIRTAELGEYDLYLMIDIIEHMTKEEGLELLRKIKGPVIVSTPIDYDQDEVDGNVYQKHLYKWKLEDFSEFEIENHSNELSLILIKK
jgi:glycosyltransferase involved in cell wall biosynthesis